MCHWLKFLVLIVLKISWLIACGRVVVFSRTWTSNALRSTQNAACIKWIWCFRSKMQTKIILRPLPIIIPGNLHCKFGAWQNSEVAGLTGDCAKWIKMLKAYCYPAYYTTAEWPDWTVPSNAWWSLCIKTFHVVFIFIICCGMETHATSVLNIEWVPNLSWKIIL